MRELSYSAGLISQSCWFREFKKFMRLKHDGLSDTEIVKKCVDENLFGATKEYRALRIARYIINRVKTMDEQIMELFLESDVATQKVISLISILKTDRLFLEFLYTVYREKLILGVPVLEESDVNVFFSRKECEVEVIAQWKDSTKRHLRSCYLNFMTDANLLTIIDKKKNITPPLLDVALEQYLRSGNDLIILKSLTGES